MKRKLWSAVISLVLLAILFGMSGGPTVASPSIFGPFEPPVRSSDEKGNDPFDQPRTRAVLLRGAVAPQQAGGPDHFGYVWNEITYPGLETLPSPTVVSFPVSPGEAADDMSAGPINIGFSFPFYWQSYSSLFVSTNGYLTFGEESQDVLRNSIPHPAVPNSFISAFADDLVVGGSGAGRIEYQTLGSPGSRRFILRWNRVNRLGFSDELTFDVVLHESSGNIQLLFHSLSGDVTQATVGIEDPDGLDGLLYLQYQEGLVSGKAVQFSRPPDGTRVKLLSSFRSSFAIQNKAEVTLNVRNTGSATDTFNLSSALVKPAGSTNWKIGFYPESGTTPLPDSNSDGKRDTGPLAPGGEMTFRVLVECTSGCTEGTYVIYQVKAASIKDGAKYDEASVQVAVPASFAEAFVDIDPNFGVGLDLIWKERRITARTTDWFSGSNLALAPLWNQNFVFLWERNERDSKHPQYLPFTDLEYAFVTNTGGVPRTRVKLTSNIGYADETHSVTDRFPAAAALADGRIGVAWVREKSDETGGELKTNPNVYFAVLGFDGNLAAQPTAVTTNQEWGIFGNERLYQSVCIAAVSNSRFLISWADSFNQSNAWTSNVIYAVYDQNGAQVKPPTTLTSSVLGEKLYLSPVLVPLTGDRTLLVYTIENADLTNDLAFVVLDSSGKVQKAETIIPNAHGTDPDAAQLSGGQVLIAWSEALSSGIGFVLYNSALASPISGPIEVHSPDNRIGGYVSVTYDHLGHGVLTWVDEQWTNYLYYMLINSSGGQVTPPMIFYPVGRETSYVISSDISQGSAPYDGRSYIFLPSMQK